MSLDAGEKLLGGFVVRVLRHEATLECPFQDALTQPGGSLQVGFDLGFNLVHDGETPLNLIDNLLLFAQRWNRNGYFAQVLKMNML